MENKSSFYKLFFVILFETSLFMLMGTIDTMMLSKYSDDAVAAVGLANQALSLAFMLFTIISTGAIIIISQYIGAKKIEKAKDISILSMIFALLFGGILSLIFYIFDDTILHLLNVDKHIYHNSKQYLHIVLAVMTINATNPVMSSIFRGFNKAKYSLYISLVSNLFNVLGNAIFIFGLFGMAKLGILGVAYSTAFAILFRSVLSLSMIYYTLKIRPTLEFISHFWENLFKIIKVGSPSALEGIVYNIMQFTIVAMVSLIGTTEVTTRIYVLNLTLFIYLGSFALAQTNQIFVGNYVGSNNREEAYQITNRSFYKAVTISMTMTLIFNVFGYHILKIFTDNQEIISLAQKLLFITFFVEMGRSLNLVYAFAFKGSGAVFFPLITGILFMWGACIPLSYFLGIKLEMGLIGIWIAYAFDELIRGIIAKYFWHKKIWAKKAIA